MKVKVQTVRDTLIVMFLKKGFKTKNTLFSCSFFSSIFDALSYLAFIKDKKEVFFKLEPISAQKEY